MADQLSAKDWLNQGLKTLAESGFTALKAEPLAKAMGVSRGSFYWHFADVEAFHAEVLRYWRDIAAERIIAAMPNPPEIQHAGSKAFYSPITDRITLPPRELFASAEKYYATALHETIHSTESQKRLAREGICEAAAFGSAV